MTVIRDVTEKAQKYLETEDILLFIGSRQAGKTTILKQLQKILQKKGQPSHFINLEDPDYLKLLNVSPKNLFKIFSLDLRQNTFIFIDEVQYLENPSNFLKYFYDEYRGKIKLCVSGSSAFYIDEKFKDSLAGRKRMFYVFTFSFREYLRCKGEDDLSQKDFNSLSLSEREKISFFYQEYIIYGGYPRVVLAPLEEKVEILRDLAYSYVKKDVFEAGVRQEDVFYKLFKILSSQIGNLVNASELAGALGVSKTSIDHYLRVMQKSFHIQLIRPFYKNVRKELTKMPKVYFSDLGLRNFFSDNFKPFETREDRGALLENAVFRQLLERYDQSEIKFWRTIQKNELDFIVKDHEAIEVKVQPGQFKEKNYRTFLENYPEMEISIVSLNFEQEKPGAYKIRNAWEI